MMKKCAEACVQYNESCPCDDCEYWINYEDDLNCSFVCASKGTHTLEEIGLRMGITLVRVKQIEEMAMQKLKKRLVNLEYKRNVNIE